MPHLGTEKGEFEGVCRVQVKWKKGQMERVCRKGLGRGGGRPKGSSAVLEDYVIERGVPAYYYNPVLAIIHGFSSIVLPVHDVFFPWFHRCSSGLFISV